MDIEAPSDDGISLERQGDDVIVGRRRCGLTFHVPADVLWRFIIDGGADFRFEGLSPDQLRSAVDHARWHGWKGWND